MSIIDRATYQSAENAYDLATLTSQATTDGNIIPLDGNYSYTFFLRVDNYVDGNFTMKIQEGDDSGLSDASDVSADFLIGTVAGTVLIADGIAKIGYVGHKQYVMPSVIAANETAAVNADISVMIVKDNPRVMPTAQ